MDPLDHTDQKCKTMWEEVLDLLRRQEELSARLAEQQEKVITRQKDVLRRLQNIEANYDILRSEAIKNNNVIAEWQLHCTKHMKALASVLSSPPEDT